VGPLPKGARLARARRELAKCLRDYPGLRRERGTLRAALTRWQRIEKLTNELYAAINEEWRRGWTYNALIDDAFKIYLLRSTAVWTEHLAMQSRSQSPLPVVARHLDQSIWRQAPGIDQWHRRPMRALCQGSNGLAASR
jgi:hypothetical protein